MIQSSYNKQLDVDELKYIFGYLINMYLLLVPEQIYSRMATKLDALYF